MKRLSALLLCAALPAGASTISLDAGDLGVQWVPGVGFRAVDGIDSYGGGKAPCPVSAVYKDGAEDRVVVERNCTQSPVTFTTLNESLFPVDSEETFTTASYGDLIYTSTGTRLPTGTPTTVTPLGTPTTSTPTTFTSCCDTITTTTIVETVTPAAVSLNQPALYLLTALFALAGLPGYFRRKA